MIDNIVVVFYFLAVLSIGLWAARDVRTIEDYATSKHGFGTFIIFATIATSYIGGGFSTGNAERNFQFGIAGTLALWGASAGDLWIARYVAPKLDRFKGAISVGDIIATHHGRIGQVITGFCGILICCGILGAQISAVGYIFLHFFNIDHTYGVLIGCGLAILYTTAGGLRSVIYTDIIQFFFLVVGLPTACIFAVLFVGGPQSLLESVPADHWTVPGPGFTWLTLTTTFLAFAVGTMLSPPLTQRLLAGKSASQSARGAFWAAILSFPILIITGLIGLAALVIAPELNPNLALPFIIDTALPPAIKGLLIAAVLSVIMSSADSFLNSASVTFTHDVCKPLYKKNLSEQQELFIARIITLTLGAGAVLFSLSAESPIDLLLLAYKVWAPIVLFPLIAVIWGIQRGPRTFVASAIAGVIVGLVWTDILEEPFGFPGLIAAVLANLLVVCLYRPATAKPVPQAEAA